MRVLVEQTAQNVMTWLTNLTLGGVLPELEQPAVYPLLGVNRQRVGLDPEKAYILVGTQDQLLSRALNRGYGMSRFRWPLHFGLLNNDCLWVFDEVQLMSSGLATSVQLEAFRKSMGTLLPVHPIWMSATLNKAWLDTVDFDTSKETLLELTLSPADSNDSSLRRRLEPRNPSGSLTVSGITSSR